MKWIFYFSSDNIIYTGELCIVYWTSFVSCLQTTIAVIATLACCSIVTEPCIQVSDPEIMQNLNRYFFPENALFCFVRTHEHAAGAPMLFAMQLWYGSCIYLYVSIDPVMLLHGSRMPHIFEFITTFLLLQCWARRCSLNIVNSTW